MEDFRSRYCADNGMQIEPYGGVGRPPASYDAKTSSSYHASSYAPKEMDLKKGSASFKDGWFNDPELQRKKRIVGYKAYSVEGRAKRSLRKSFRWLKDRYTRIVYGWS
ncbi:hypothetical protein AXF42_Ash014564 [Apostasia shenzhenica]|uniref:DUF3511 domain-containing protein n=1 Tax=Apostasia shenzhenica TaxID=1088818 RepID=A0A2I0AK06_9ASPA|nr:hypothetical protein AXF42_Ash014564 [Apostasia shenzhenica]